MSDAAAGSASSGPGATLRRAREVRGWTAAQAADSMRLPASVVEALEGNRYSDLGAAVFARGHLRRYATLLELPVEPLLDAYDRSQSGPLLPTLIPPASAHTPVRAEGDRLRLPAAAWYALGLAAIVAAGAGGWWWWTQREPVAALPAAAPAEQPAGDESGTPPGSLAEPAGPIPEAAPADATAEVP